MSDTPRTDAMVRMMIDNDHGPEWLEKRAQQLERELAAAHRQVADLMAELDREIQAKHRVAMETRNPLLAKLGQMSAELAAKDARIRRLEKVGDEMERWMRNPRNLGGDPFMADQWQDAKETRP